MFTTVVDIAELALRLDDPAWVITEAIFYCGSGINAAHAALALAHAGLGNTRIYPGSWREWITDPARPVATGEW